MKELFVAITDTHLDEDNYDQVLNIFKQAVLVVKKYKLKELYHFGDHFTARSSQKLKTLLDFKKILDFLEKEDVILITIPGNHDKTDQSSTDSYLQIYNSSHLKVYSEEIILQIKNITICLLPYFTEEEYERRLKCLKEEVINSSNKTILGTHFGINGVLNNDGSKVNSTVEVGRYKAFDLTLIGHFHNYNKVTNKVFYIGSGKPKNFGEDSNKGCVVVNDDLTMERIKFDFIEYEKIEITNFETTEIDKLLKIYKSQTDEKKIRFEFVGTEEDFLKIDKKKINQLGIEVTTINTTSVKEIEEASETKMSLNLSTKDILDKFKKYSDKNGVDKTKSKEILKYLQ